MKRGTVVRDKALAAMKDASVRLTEEHRRAGLSEDAFTRRCGHTSHPIEVRGKGQKIAVRVISQFGEECTKVLVA